MPHYKGGEVAIVGDLVSGKTYNTANAIVGTVVSVTAAADTCNCLVAFAKLVELPALSDGRQWHDYWRALHAAPTTTTGDKGGLLAVVGELDYTDAKQLCLLSRPT
jgi:hypothetical protein